MKRREKKRRILCFETQKWESNYGKSKESYIKPLFNLMDLDRKKLDYEIAMVGSLKGFKDELKEWNNGFDILYLAFDGSPGKIHLPRQKVALPELGDILDGTCTKRIVHFASCETLKDSLPNIRDFLRKTKACAVSGYKKKIDWCISAAFDMFYLSMLQYVSLGKDCLNDLKEVDRKCQRYMGGLYRELGFSLYRG